MSEVNFYGPFFDAAHTHAHVGVLMNDCVRQVAAQASAEVHHNLDTSIRHPTPYYETQINVRVVSQTQRIVNDRGVIYGHWLEGTGSRNRTTRFKGYFSFRRATQKVNRMVRKLCANPVAKFVGRMN